MKTLLINPYIYDFACYDYWLKPLGLLYISSILKDYGFEVDMIDCMDRHHPALPATKDRADGRGNIFHEERPKPDALNHVKRKYSIYGLYGEKFEKQLELIGSPDIVLISSSMTYWYLSLAEITSLCRKYFPSAKIIVGGIYVTLCQEHAKEHIDADVYIKGNELGPLFSELSIKAISFPEWPTADFSFYSHNSYLVMRTSIGCPNSCSYCGIKSIAKNFRYKTSEKISTEIEYLYQEYGIKKIAFYDDALLSNIGFVKYMDKPLDGLELYTPNGIEISKIDMRMAQKLYSSGFIEPCLSVDYVSKQGFTKTNTKMIENAVSYLKTAGYKDGEIACYMILASPGQDLDRLKTDIDYIHSLGFKINLAEYAIVPGSKDFQMFSDIQKKEPLLHNNSIYPALIPEQQHSLIEVKEKVKNLNADFNK